MNRAKKLSKDIVLFAIASFGPKLLSFFLVPLYTSCLTTEQYGIADLLYTIGSLLLPILTLDISDAVLIYTIEKKQDRAKKNGPLLFGMDIYKKSCMLLLGVLVLIAVAFSNTRITMYCCYIFIYYVNMALYNNLLAYMRGTDKVTYIVNASVLNSLITIFSNIVLLLVVKIGLYGYLAATLIGGIVTNIYLYLKLNLKTIFSCNTVISKEEKTKMLKYSFPLIFTGLAWWLNSSSDRLFISLLAGVSANGIYAAANKIPSILSACHSIIYQAMQLSVFSEIHSEDRNDYLHLLYRIYNFLMVLICFVLIFLDKILAKLLFKGDFYVAWKYAPALLVSIVLFSSSGYITTIISALKETKIIAKATISGAILNTILNILLISKYSLYGAVVATMAGYFLIWLVIVVNAERLMNMKFGIINSVIMYALLILQWIVILYNDNILIELIILFLICYMNKQTIAQLIDFIKKIMKNVLNKVH